MNSVLSDAAFWNRLQFGFTLVYHYLFPQLTMGLAWFLVYWKWTAYRTGEEKYNQAARFWAKIFGVNFAVGVVTGIPMEFQFGTNWADFSRYAGGVIGQTLAMEGMFAFFLESAFVGALIWGEKRLGPRDHFLAAVAVALGSWTSGYFILVTNAFMQHPVGYGIAPDGSLSIASLGTYLLNPWGLIQFAHNQTAAVVTGAFVVAAVGALYSLGGVHPRQARLYLGAGTFVGLIAFVVVAFPTGDQQARMVGDHQPVTLAAMEGKFVGGPMAGVSVAFANFERWRNRLESNRWLLWVLMLAFPFPYIANTLGWMTAELGRQPWLVYGLFRTQEGYSKVVSSGDTIFTLIGFTGLYFVLGLLFLYLVGREIGHGPEDEIAVNEGRQLQCDRDLVRNCQFHASRLYRPGWEEFWRRDAPLARRQNAR